MEYLLAEQLAAMSANQLYTQLGADWADRL